MISVVILTKDSEKTIERALRSSQNFDEIIIIDTGSVDQTINIVKKWKNARLVSSEFLGFGALRNLAAKQAKNDWILALDSDEKISDKLFHEISLLTLDPGYVYSIPFLNFYQNKQIKCCGWHKERHLRLYHRKFTRFSTALVHEKLITKELKIKKLQHPIYHYPYQSIDDFLRKMQHYSSLFAKQNHLKKKSSLFRAIVHGAFAFFKSFIIKRGIFGGKEGFMISVYNANTAFYKYLKLEEMNNKKCF